MKIVTPHPMYPVWIQTHKKWERTVVPLTGTTKYPIYLLGMSADNLSLDNEIVVYKEFDAPIFINPWLKNKTWNIQYKDYVLKNKKLFLSNLVNYIDESIFTCQVTYLLGVE